MVNLPGTDRETLMRKAYASAEGYTTRMRIHELYSEPKISFAEWVMERIAWRGDELVLDIGSGPGAYFEPVRTRIPNGRLVAGDLSLGMARKAAKHPAGATCLNIDVQTLPFPNRTFDVVLANHMLYHVPDLDLAVAEIHRVLKPTGVLVASTNSQYTMPELEHLIQRAYELLGARRVDIEQSRPYQFYLEDATMKLGRRFFAVARYDFPSIFVFPTAQPAIDYVNSMRSLREPSLPAGIVWEDFIAVLDDQIQRRINHFGEWLVSKLAGAVVATDGGGFFAEYIETYLYMRHLK